jgi:hypothetical protein
MTQEKITTPQPGQWWFRNDMKARLYVCGLTLNGTPVWERKDSAIYASGVWSDFHHEPDCTGWDWAKPKPKKRGVWVRFYDNGIAITSIIEPRPSDGYVWCEETETKE